MIIKAALRGGKVHQMITCLSLFIKKAAKSVFIEGKMGRGLMIYVNDRNSVNRLDESRGLDRRLAEVPQKRKAGADKKYHFLARELHKKCYVPRSPTGFSSVATIQFN